MKKIFLSILAISFLLPITPIFAHNNVETKTPEEIVQNIQKEQNVSSKTSINCSSVDQHTMEELGDAVMSARHEDPKIHEYMDNMMGGEGSDSLKNAHMLMAQEYIGCIDSNSYEMMGSGMMNNTSYMMNDSNSDNMNSSNYSNMMNYSSMNTFMNVFGITAWIFLVLGILWLIKNLISSKK